jgi:hypothetical protein
MLEHGRTWELEGPEGTTVTLNASPVNGLYLEEVTGFDMPQIRQNIEDLPEADGAVAGDFFFGHRSVTLRGKIVSPTAAERNQLALNMQRTIRGLRGDVTLRSQPSGQPAMQATGRLEAFRLTGGYVKEFLISFVCPDPRIYAQSLSQETVTGSTASVGAAFPWSFPVNFGGGTGAALTVTASNEGNIDTPAIIRVWGPLNNPQIHNIATGEIIYLDAVSLGSGQWIEVDTGAKTAVRHDGTNAYNNVRFPGSWWKLVPGANLIRVFGSGEGPGAELDVSWRSAWA